MNPGWMSMAHNRLSFLMHLRLISCHYKLMLKLLLVLMKTQWINISFGDLLTQRTCVTWGWATNIFFSKDVVCFKIYQMGWNTQTRTKRTRCRFSLCELHMNLKKKKKYEAIFGWFFFFYAVAFAETNFCVSAVPGYVKVMQRSFTK